jgi:hypothetical protein
MNESPDKLFDCSSAHLAVVFGRRTIEMIRDGRDPFEAARLAGSFAQRVIDAQPKVIGRITPETPWGDAPTCYVSAADYQRHW